MSLELRLWNTAVGAGEYALYLGFLYATNKLFSGDVPIASVIPLLTVGTYATCDSVSRIVFNVSIRNLGDFDD
jgi:hypothetical protein